MPAPPGDADGEAAWAAVAATVRPLAVRRAAEAGRRTALLASAAVPADAKPRRAPQAPAPPRGIRDTLDGGWDRRLKRGAVSPEAVIDLHGHTLATAHAALDAGLASAVASGARLVLVIAGRMPRTGSRLDDPLRGVIRASLGDWLHHGRHAEMIAATRAAHPRHGGAGALYLVLRRRR